MRKYEITAVLAGTTPDTEVAGLFDRVQKILADAGATDLERLDLNKHKLSYKINQNTHGHFAAFTFSADPAAVKVIEQKIRLANEVIRFSIELFVSDRYKKNPMIADNPLIKASREREREERGERERGERSERAERPDRAEASVPVFTETSKSAADAAPTIQKIEESKPIDLAEIDKKLDELLQGDLTPSV